MDTPFRVGISGSYGGLNLGDEAILEGILGELRVSLPVEVTVFSRNPEDTLARHGVERAVPVREMSREEIRPEIARLDLFILGGGGILFDAEVDIYLREVMLAHDLGVPVFVYAVSAGPLDRFGSRAAVKDALDRAAVISVRERRSQHLLESIGVTREIHITADPALLLTPHAPPADSLAREGIERRGAFLIGISVREPGVAAPDLDPERYHALLANAADYMIDRFDADLIFVPLESRMLDLQHSHAVLAKMVDPSRARVLKRTYTAGEMLAFMKNFDFAVGMRLHFLVFAALQRIPFVALPYGGKVEGFLEDLEMPMPRVQRITAGQLIAHIDKCLDTRQDLVNRIGTHITGLIGRARITNRLVVQLLRSRRGPTRVA